MTSVDVVSQDADQDPAEHGSEKPESQATADGSTGLRSYVRIARTPGMPAWTTVVVCQRLPVAMSPLALVYLGKLATSSYVVGAVLAGVNAFAEALAAGVMGRRFDRRSQRSEIQLVLGVQAALLLALAIPNLVRPGSLPVAVLVVLAAGAGAIAAGAHGGLRALLVRTVDESVHHAALSLESTLTTLVWAVGPAIVGFLVLFAGSAWPLVLCAAIACVGIVAARTLPEPRPAKNPSAPAGVRTSIWRRCWPATFQEGAVMVCVGAAYTGLPTLLSSDGLDGGIAGLVLAVFAVAGIVGGLVYGARAWRSSYRRQTTVLVLVVIGLIGLAVLMPNAALVIGFMVASGFVGTPALAARAAGLQELLPESTWAAGFSSLYAAGGVGFGAAGLILAGLLDHTSIHLALLACVLLAAVAAVAGSLGERRISRMAHD